MSDFELTPEDCFTLGIVVARPSEGESDQPDLDPQPTALLDGFGVGAFPLIAWTEVLDCEIEDNFVAAKADCVVHANLGTGRWCSSSSLTHRLRL